MQRKESFCMLNGSLQIKNGIYQTVFYIPGKKKPIWRSTGIKAQRGNKRKAEAMLLEARRQYTSLSDMQKRTHDTLFSDYLLSWVTTCKAKVAVST